METPQLIIANSDRHFEDGKVLFQEYAASLPIDLTFQRFAEELETVRNQYGPPAGALIIAYVGERAVGCAGIRTQVPGTAELKRMYVKPEFRGYQIGRILLQESISQAANLGYQKIRLDTLASMTGARNLYDAFGFKVIPAYYPNPHEDAIYMEKTL